MCVTACTNGHIRITNAPLAALQSVGEQGLGLEISRTLVNGTIIRSLSGGPYSKEVLGRDGTRTLMRDPAFNMAAYKKAHSSTDHRHRTHHRKGTAPVPKIPGFHEKLIDSAPPSWNYVRLDGDGTVNFSLMR